MLHKHSSLTTKIRHRRKKFYRIGYTGLDCGIKVISSTEISQLFLWYRKTKGVPRILLQCSKIEIKKILHLKMADWNKIYSQSINAGLRINSFIHLN